SRSRSCGGRGLPCVARPQHAGACARRGQSQGAGAKRRRRSVREEGAVPGAGEGLRRGEGRLPGDPVPGAVHAFTNPEATELGKKFNLPLRYDAKANKAAKAEADKLFAATLKK